MGKPRDSQDPSKYLKAGEAAALVNVSAWKIYDLARRGELPFFRVGSRGPLRFHLYHVFALLRGSENWVKDLDEMGITLTEVRDGESQAS